MSLSSLTPIWAPRPRAQQQPAARERAPVSAPSMFTPSAPAYLPTVPTPSVETPRRIAIENLTVDDIRDASISTLNALVPHRPDLIGRLIVDAGKMRRAELPLRMSTMRPVARCMVLSGERRRGRELNEEETAFMADFLESIGQ
jgi:hypothetical protein